MDNDPPSVHNRIVVDNDIDPQFRPEAEEIKEVYARFGRAYYYSECLHRNLCIFYATSKILDVRPMTRSRLDEHYAEAFSFTLGKLIAAVEADLPPQLIPTLDEVLKRRNLLAHHFWYERIALMMTSNGITKMIEELDECADLFAAADQEVDRLIASVSPRLGVTQEMLDSTLHDLMSGVPVESIAVHRKMRKQEVIVGIYHAPSTTFSGKSVLVFEADDGLVLQLCDSGLGWSHYPSVDDSWPKAEKFADLLPCPLNPRPTASGPWHFDLLFKNKAVLTVRPGSENGAVLYQLKRITPARGPIVPAPK